MSPNLVKVCKASNARKLAFAYSSRSHGRRRRQKASAATMQFIALAWPSRTKRVPQERHLVKVCKASYAILGTLVP